MKRPTTNQLDAYLERVVNRLRDLRQLNLSAETGIHQALEESQNLLASIAMYRHQLKTIALKGIRLHAIFPVGTFQSVF